MTTLELAVWKAPRLTAWRTRGRDQKNSIGSWSGGRRVRGKNLVDDRRRTASRHKRGVLESDIGGGIAYNDVKHSYRLAAQKRKFPHSKPQTSRGGKTRKEGRREAGRRASPGEKESSKVVGGKKLEVWAKSSSRHQRWASLGKKKKKLRNGN